jgi:hypothetical protein
MKKKVVKSKDRSTRRNLSQVPRKSWLRIYSHVAYVLSAFNLFLFPERANVQAAPSNAMKNSASIVAAWQMPSRVDIHGQLCEGCSSTRCNLAGANNNGQTCDNPETLLLKHVARKASSYPLCGPQVSCEG